MSANERNDRPWQSVIAWVFAILASVQALSGHYESAAYSMAAAAFWRVGGLR